MIIPIKYVRGQTLKADKVIELMNKYSEGGSHNAIRDSLMDLRDERLAHRQIEPDCHGR